MYASQDLIKLAHNSNVEQLPCCAMECFSITIKLVWCVTVPWSINQILSGKASTGNCGDSDTQTEQAGCTS